MAPKKKKSSKREVKQPTRESFQDSKMGWAIKAEKRKKEK